MEFLQLLWLPIILAGVILFVASFVAWMILPHHRTDWKKLDQEHEVMAAIKDMGIPPGSYMFPYSSSNQEMQSEEFQKRYNDGPRGTLNLWKVPKMTTNMICTFVFFLLSTAIIGYVTYAALGRLDLAYGARFMKVFEVAGTIGILTHGSSGVLNGIWFQRRMVNDMVDGIVYGLLIGLIFGLMWPAAASV